MEEADEERTRWVLNRGLGVGKQILVAGFLAFSAPVVLPPLLGASVIGISVSMPFGLLLVSHACTHKLMSKLLPMPTLTPPNYVLEGQHRIEVCQEEYADHINIEQVVQQKQTRGIEMVHVKDTNMALENKDEPHTCEEEKASPEVEVVITIEGIDKITNIVALEDFGDEDMEKETKRLLEKVRDECKSDARDQIGIANATDQRIGPTGDEEKEDPEVSEHIKKVDDRNRIDSQKPIPRDARENADESGFDLFDETNTYTIDLQEEPSNAMVDAVWHGQHSTQSEYSSARDINNEVMLNEEELWKDINAVRLIVGYEGAPQASCIDEVKNLYIVTGVEPPQLNDSCNPLEINDKLHFLMSILGVKSNVP